MPVRAPRNERILLFSPKRAKAAPRFLEHLLHVIWSFVRFVRFVVTLCRGFYFRAIVAPARALRRTQHTRIGRHGGGSVLRNGTDASPHPRRADFARNPPVTPFDGNPTRFVFVFVHGATASDHFPPTRPDAQLRRCTWPRRPPSAWASASSPVPSGRYASRPAKFEPRRALAGPRHPARLTPAETKKYPHGPPSAFLDVRTRPRLTRLPRLLPQNWHWQTKREVEAFYAKGK